MPLESISFGKGVKVFLTIPNMHWIHSSVVNALLNMVLAEAARGRYEITVKLPYNVPYENNLHIIIQHILENGFQYWINIDADNPPLKNVFDLVELDKDVICCPTPVWCPTAKCNRPYYFTGYMKKEYGYTEYSNPEGLQEVDAIGSGCMVISRRVLEHQSMKSCFTRFTYENGVVFKGADISFSERAKGCGFKLYTHYGYICDHYKELSLLNVAARMTANAHI